MLGLWLVWLLVALFETYCGVRFDVRGCYYFVFVCVGRPFSFASLFGCLCFVLGG